MPRVSPSYKSLFHMEKIERRPAANISVKEMDSGGAPELLTHGFGA
jgi:hypothetical protein